MPSKLNPPNYTHAPPVHHGSLDGASAFLRDATVRTNVINILMTVLPTQTINYKGRPVLLTTALNMLLQALSSMHSIWGQQSRPYVSLPHSQKTTHSNMRCTHPLSSIINPTPHPKANQGAYVGA